MSYSKKRSVVIAEEGLIQKRLLEGDTQAWIDIMDMGENIARRVCPRHLRSQHEADCAKEGIEALLKRDMRYVKKFEPQRSIRFSDYAYARMQWAMVDYLAKQRVIRLPRQFRKILKTYSELWERQGYEPSASEIVSALGDSMTPQKVEEALRWQDAYFVRINQPSDSTNEDSTPFEPPSKAPTPEEEVIGQEEQKTEVIRRKQIRKQVEMVPIALRMLDNPNHMVVWSLSVFGSASDLEIEQALFELLNEESEKESLLDDKASYEEIAQVLDGSSGTVGQWKRRAKEKVLAITKALSRPHDQNVEEICRETGASERQVKVWREGYQVLKLLPECSVEQICSSTGLTGVIVEKWAKNADAVNMLLTRARQRLQEIRTTRQDKHNEGGSSDV